MPKKIEVLTAGDVVRLLCGGPAMTVRSVETSASSNGTNRVVTVDWCGADGTPYRSSYLEEQLALDSKPKG